MRWFGGILINALLFLFLAWLIPNFVVESLGIAILASIVLAIVNMLVRPFLVFFTLPATIVTLGLFLFVINALMLLLTNKVMGDGFIIDGFGTALLIAIFMSLLNLVLNGTVLKSARQRRWWHSKKLSHSTKWLSFLLLFFCLDNNRLVTFVQA